MKRLLSLLLLLGAPYAASADDIDIYSNPVSNPGSEPLVMFSLDYRSNLSSTVCGTDTDTDGDGVGECQELVNEGYLSSIPTSRFQLYRAVFRKVFADLEGVKVGFMLNHNHNNNCAGAGRTGCSNGGYILSGFNLFQAGDANGAKAALANKLAGIPLPQGNVSHSYQGKELFFELYRYLNAGGVYNGHNGYTDFGTSNRYNLDQAADYTPSNSATPAKWDSTIESGTNYIDPFSSSCQKVYTVNILFSVSNQDSDSDSAITAATPGGMDRINLSGRNNDFSTVIRWMYDNDNSRSQSGKQNVISYFVVEQVNTTTSSYAGAGVGVSSATPYSLSDDPSALIATLQSIFRNILTTSTTFVAPAVAVNVYNRAQVRSEVYIAMFQAEQAGNWPGNIKKYDVGRNSVSGEPEIQDVQGNFAVATDGRIKFEALSYWTLADDLPYPPTNSLELVDNKDGRAVARGGAGSKIPGYKLSCSSATDQTCTSSENPGFTNPTGATTNVSDRKLFVPPASGTGTLRALNANSATATALQADFGATSVGTCDQTDTDSTSACALILFARGLEYDATNSRWRARKWLMGDLLHSRPLAVNYGARTSSYSADNPDIRIVAGSNSGFLHMLRNIKPGQTDPKSPNDMDGVEAWAFMPTEVMPEVKNLKAAYESAAASHSYMVDGAPAVYTLDENGDGNITGNDKVYVYFGLRRGGTAYYALDISDPDNPSLLWKISKSGDFAQLGQTWSTPRVGKMVFDNATVPEPVLVFAGGYDPNKDTHPGHGSYTGTAIGTNDSQGNAIFIVKAATGELVWKAVKGSSNAYNSSTKTYEHPSLNDSIPSDVVALDTDGNKLVDRIYVGDTGGVVWRVDMKSNDQANWRINPILSVGRHATNSLASDRRFFYPPDYVQSKDASGAFDGVIIGAGDRENPMDTDVANYFYMFKDRDITSGVTGANSAYPVAHPDLADVTDYTAAPSGGDILKGWRIKLECPPDRPSTCGEKSLSTALTVNGVIYFTTYKPAAALVSSSCQLSEGSGLLYARKVQDGTPGLENADGTFDEDGVIELASGGIPAEVVSLGGGYILRPDLYIQKIKGTGYKTFWFQKQYK